MSYERWSNRGRLSGCCTLNFEAYIYRDNNIVLLFIRNIWAAALKEKPPKEVTVKVDVIYFGNDMSPYKFIVTYNIDGKPGNAKLKIL